MSTHADGLANDAAVAVIGAGTMGAGIAQVAAAAGHRVVLYDAHKGAAATGKERTAAGLAKLVDKGKMAAEDRDALLARIEVAGNLKDLAPAALVIEAIIEDADIKRSVFEEVEKVVGEDAILATNTSTISVTALARDLTRPGRFAGMHFFNPAPIMKLVEVVSGLGTDCAVAQTLFDTAAAWGKKPVHARSVPGFIVNRVARPFYSEGFRALQEGAADAATIDYIYTGCGGFRMGPFALTDLIGQDVNSAVSRTAFDAYYGEGRFLPALAQEELVAAGRLGRKSGHGFFPYGDGADAPAPKLAAKTDLRPQEINLAADLGPLERLGEALQAAGLDCSTRVDIPAGMIEIGGAFLGLTDGRLATELAARHKRSVILLDHAAEAQTGKVICLAAADQTWPQELETVAGMFQGLGAEVVVIDDHPGMILMRTVAMLANSAADAVRDHVASPADVDTAMTFGLNYPAGPLAWAETIGRDWILRVLDNLADTVGEDRYRPSQWLRRRVLANRPLTGG